MRDNAINRLLGAIGYPDTVPDGNGASCELRVDGESIIVEVAEGRLILKRRLTDDGEMIAQLAEYAPGRMLRDNAVLAVERGGEDASAFLWQEISAQVSDVALVRFFETFMDSWDWWNARLENTEQSAPLFQEILIRP